MIKTSLLPHQKAMRQFYNRLRVGYLKGDPGTGKTLAMLSLAEQKKGYFCIVWVAPHSTLVSLASQIHEHTSLKSSLILEEAASYADVVLVSYEAIQASDNTCIRLNELIENSFLVLDEAHFIKNIMAKRTKRILKLAPKAKYRFAMSGTPIGQDVYDWFSQLYALSPKVWGYTSWNQFKRYHIVMKTVHGSFGSREVMRTVHQAELTRRLKPYLFEFDKSNLIELPEKKYIKVEVDPSRETIKKYQGTKREILHKYANYGITESVVYRLIVALHQIVGLDEERIAQTVNLASEHSKSIVWCKYKEEIDMLEQAIGTDSCVSIDGRTKLKDRESLLTQFKTNDEKRMLLTNQQVSGTGLNLQFVDTQIFHNQSFDFILRQQAENRIHRIGQNSSNCIYYDLVSCFNVDQVLQGCLRRKKKINDFVKDLLRDTKHLPIKEIEARLGAYL